MTTKIQDPFAISENKNHGAVPPSAIDDEQDARLLTVSDDGHSFVVHSIAKCNNCHNLTACKDASSSAPDPATTAADNDNLNSTNPASPHLLCMECCESIPCSVCKQKTPQLVWAANKYLCNKCNADRLRPSPPIHILTAAISIPAPASALSRGLSPAKYSPTGTPPDSVTPMRGIVSTPMYTPPNQNLLGPVMPRTQRITSLNHHDWVRAQEASKPSPTVSPAPGANASALSSTPPSFSMLSVSPPNNGSVLSSSPPKTTTISLAAPNVPVASTGATTSTPAIPPIVTTSNQPNDTSNNNYNTPASVSPYLILNGTAALRPIRSSPHGSLNAKKKERSSGKLSEIDREHSMNSRSRHKTDEDDGDDDYLNISSKISLDGKLDYARRSDNSISEALGGDNSRSDLQIVEIDDVPAESRDSASYYPEPAN